MKARLIARLDIKGENLIKGVQLEGLRVIGDPNSFARKYFESGIDEFIFMDSVASLYGRNQLGSIIERITENMFGHYPHLDFSEENSCRNYISCTIIVLIDSI
jgi:cyclase